MVNYCPGIVFIQSVFHGLIIVVGTVRVKGDPSISFDFLEIVIPRALHSNWFKKPAHSLFRAFIHQSTIITIAFIVVLDERIFSCDLHIIGRFFICVFRGELCLIYWISWGSSDGPGLGLPDIMILIDVKVQFGLRRRIASITHFLFLISF